MKALTGKATTAICKYMDNKYTDTKTEKLLFLCIGLRHTGIYRSSRLEHDHHCTTE